MVKQALNLLEDDVPLNDCEFIPRHISVNASSLGCFSLQSYYRFFTSCRILGNLHDIAYVIDASPDTLERTIDEIESRYNLVNAPIQYE